jgi:hypothetical protein
MRLASIGTVDEYIIKEDKNKLAKERPQDGVHQALKSGRGVCQAEGHNHELKVAFMGAECRLLNVVDVHPNLVVHYDGSGDAKAH